jgi:hypothetical protein
MNFQKEGFYKRTPCSQGREIWKREINICRRQEDKREILKGSTRRRRHGEWGFKKETYVI